ncbi:MAG: glycosyltransferase family 39 protein [Dysgonamonadaceae bacterium]|nr:glycosyltransferase family 39 protein [Dysgonamonadaceae bacterium]
MTLLILMLFISVIFWIGKGDFYTKGEPREASVAVSMLEEGQWILPEVYADEIAYKPPLTHWLTAVFSLPQGKVTPFSSRLPSALAFAGLIVFSFIFFGKNLKFQDAFLAALIMLTSFELHRGAMTARVDMLLAFLIVLALTRLFRWEERKQLNGFPFVIPIIMGMAALTKGPVGIILPLLVFGIYLLFLKYNFWKIAGKLLLMALLSMILPLVWYLLAYQTGGKEFLDIVWAENFGRFLSSENLNIQYNLGHEEAWWYNILTLLGGFLPWTILLFISLFGFRYALKIPGFKQIRDTFVKQEKIKLFSAVAAIVIILFYCIPSGKRSVYLMPAYPFISVFIAQYVLYLTEYKVNISRIFSWVIGVIACLTGLIVFLTITTHIVEPMRIVQHFVKHQRTMNDIAAAFQATSAPKVLYDILLCVLLYAIYILFKYLWKKNNLKTLYATVGVYLALLLVLDGIFLPSFKDGVSVKPFAKSLLTNYPIREDNLFVMNNLLEYSNMYGLNFYLHNHFQNFEKELPSEGYFLVGEGSFTKVLEKYGKDYQFDLLEAYQNKNRDGERVIQLYFFALKLSQTR